MFGTRLEVEARYGDNGPMVRVLLLPEKSFAGRERALLERLSVGLADEGARVFQGVPGVGLDAEDVRNERLGLFATPVPFADRGLPWTESLRAGVLVESVARASATGMGGFGGGSLGRPVGVGGGTGVQIVHAFGRSTWELAWQTAAKSRSGPGGSASGDVGGAASVVVEVYSGSCVEAAASWAAKLAHRDGGPTVWWNAADPALGAELNRAMVGIKGGAALRVGSNAWGVHVPEEPHSEIDPTRTGTVVLWCGGGASGGGLKGRRVASGRELKEVAALFEGLRARSQSPRGLLVLANEPTADRLGLWKLARTMDLSACLSVVPELTERWDLTLEADALVIPSADGEQHGFVLDAMAAGMPIIARADDLASHLVDHETAVLVRESTAAAWRNAASELLDQPARAVSLGSSARQFIREKRLASAWVAGVMKLYERAVSGR